MTKIVQIVVLIIGFCAMAQDRVTLSGRIISGSNGVPGVFVINKTAGLEAKSDNAGYFNIKAKKGDGLIIYNSKIVVREFVLAASAFETTPYVISVNYSAAELDEVVIDKYNVNSESLGIVPKGQLKRTVAERRLFTAGAFTVGTVIGLDPIINAISGRTQMLRRAYETEKHEMLIAGVKNSFDEETISEQYGIPKDKVSGFLYYIAEQKKFKDAVKQGNKQYIDFLMMGLAKDYLKLQQDDK